MENATTYGPGSYLCKAMEPIYGEVRGQGRRTGAGRWREYGDSGNTMRRRIRVTAWEAVYCSRTAGIASKDQTDIQHARTKTKICFLSKYV
jgi:hypothetical protein